MRGEDAKLHLNSLYGKGSPPHARGRHKYNKEVGEKIRITPACAGKTLGDWLDGRRQPGSPPHARGRLDFEPNIRAVPGITPACAGKTPTDTSSATETPDHPRMRGEDS